MLGSALVVALDGAALHIIVSGACDQPLPQQHAHQHQAPWPISRGQSEEEALGKQRQEEGEALLQG